MHLGTRYFASETYTQIKNIYRNEKPRWRFCIGIASRLAPLASIQFWCGILILPPLAFCATSSLLEFTFERLQRHVTFSHQYNATSSLASSSLSFLKIDSPLLHQLMLKLLNNRRNGYATFPVRFRTGESNCTTSCWYHSWSIRPQRNPILWIWIVLFGRWVPETLP